MTKTSICLAMMVIVSAAGCRERSETLKRDQQQYDVVQEGQTSGVSSTINAPGEVPPPPPGMTGTNLDTTSNFTLMQVSPTTTGSPGPGTLAGTLPVVTQPSSSRPRRATTATTVEQTTTTTTRSETANNLEGPPSSSSTAPSSTGTAPPTPPRDDKSKTPPTDTPPPPTTTTT